MYLIFNNFQDNIEPSLPEITYFGADFLDFTPPFASPVKKLARTGLYNVYFIYNLHILTNRSTLYDQQWSEFSKEGETWKMWRIFQNWGIFIYLGGVWRGQKLSGVGGGEYTL